MIILLITLAIIFAFANVFIVIPKLNRDKRTTSRIYPDKPIRSFKQLGDLISQLQGFSVEIKINPSNQNSMFGFININQATYRYGLKDIVVTSDRKDNLSLFDISISTHEYGHAIQDKESKLGELLHLRYAITLSCLFLMLFSIALNNSSSTNSSLIQYILIFLCLILLVLTSYCCLRELYIELDASKRAIKIINDLNLFTEGNIKYAEKLLFSYWNTYLTSEGAILCILYLYFYVLIMHLFK